MPPHMSKILPHMCLLTKPQSHFKKKTAFFILLSPNVFSQNSWLDHSQTIEILGSLCLSDQAMLPLRFIGFLSPLFLFTFPLWMIWY